MGCDNSASDVLKCLRGVSASVLVTNQFAVPIATFVLEPRVLPEDPVTVLQRDGSPVPLLIGSTREEATGTSLPFDPSLTPAQYPPTIQANFGFLGSSAVEEILDLYPASAYDHPFWALVAVTSDINITCEVREAARAAIGPPNEPQYAPVWRYLFTHRFENDTSLKALRAFHTAELYFLFGNFNSVSPPNLGVNYTPTPEERAFSSTLMGYWTRFATKGDPNGPGAFQWPRYSAHDTILQLDVAPARLPGYHNPQCNFLQRILDTFCSENICSP